LEGRKALRTLLQANKRLNTAYLLKESFGLLWSYEQEGWARRFFENWRAALKWQRLKPYEKFADMIDRHWVESPPTANRRTKSRSASSKGSTTKSGSSNDARTDYEMKSTFVSKSSRACCRCCDASPPFWP
jgi:Transposase